MVNNGTLPPIWSPALVLFEYHFFVSLKKDAKLKPLSGQAIISNLRKFEKQQCMIENAGRPLCSTVSKTKTNMRPVKHTSLARLYANLFRICS